MKDGQLHGLAIAEEYEKERMFCEEYKNDKKNGIQIGFKYGCFYKATQLVNNEEKGWSRQFFDEHTYSELYYKDYMTFDGYGQTYIHGNKTREGNMQSYEDKLQAL